MDADDWLAIALLLLGLVLLGFSSTASAIFASLGRHYPHLVDKMADEDSPLGRTLRRSRVTTSALIIFRTVAVVLIAMSAVTMMTSFFGLSPASLAATAFLVLFLVVLVQVVFRTLVSQQTEKAARLGGPAMAILVSAMAPFAGFFHAIADLAISGAGPRSVQTGLDDLEGDLLAPRPGEEAAREDERKMIKGVFEMEQTPVSQIMVPRVDIEAIEVSTPFQEAVDFIIEQGYSRIPVYEDTIDNIVGVVYAKDFLKTLCVATPEADLRTIAHPALFVPEYKKIDELLREFRQKKVHIAIVVDEYGGTEGLVTIEDLLEQIVGEIEDEYDTEEREVEMVSEREAVVDARVSVEEINDLFGLSLKAEDFDTVGGLLLARLGRIPAVGDTVLEDGATFFVLSTAGKGAKKVRVVKNENAEEAGKPQ